MKQLKSNLTFFVPILQNFWRNSKVRDWKMIRNLFLKLLNNFLWGRKRFIVDSCPDIWKNESTTHIIVLAVMPYKSKA